MVEGPSPVGDSLNQENDNIEASDYDGESEESEDEIDSRR